ncbi:MAG: TIGR04255 family protein [Planctomycetia bacterium]|nr:TIGR04255 family protein [Planctomycetia bacterium]
MAMNPERPFKFHLQERFQHLPAAPIVEAVIHWVARAGKSLSADELRRQLTERLPDYPDCQAQHELQLEATFSEHGSTQQRRDTWRGFRLTSSDKLYIAQFNRDGLVFSRLKPYDNWQTFSQEALRLWRIFAELAKPSEVQRLGVRFINRIDPIKLSDLGKYLAKPPRCLEALGVRVTGFLNQSVHDVPDHPFRIRVAQTIQPLAPPHTEGFGLIVDIDVGTTHPIGLSDEVLQDYLAKMRWLKNKAFFTLLTKRAIRSFQKGTT